MPETKIEQVARALCRVKYDPMVADGLMSLGDATMDEHVNQMWHEHTTEARAAVEAMRVPTEAMHEAGGKIIEEGDGNPADKPLPTLRNAYTAMIDAALKEGTDG